MTDWRFRLGLEDKSGRNVQRFPPEESTYNFNSVDGGLIMEITHYHINARALGELRLVSKHFAAFVESSTPMINNLVFHVCGKHPNYKSNKTGNNVPTPIRVMTDSLLSWAHVKFSYLDLEADFVGHQELFQKFITETCTFSLRSLTLTNVYCPMGRFLEILSYCTNLVELKIVNCSSIFGTGFDIINWYKFINPFRRCLSKIQHFTVNDGRRSATVLDTTMIQVWMSNMQQLVSLDLRSSYGEFPIHFLMQIVERNVNTLRNLSLVGECKIDGTVMDTLSRLSLRSLLLGRVTTDAGFDDFLRTQENLESLHFYNITIQRTCLDTIGYMEHLNQLHFEDVNAVGSSAITRADDPKHPFTNLVTLTDLRLQSVVDPKSCYSWAPLFQEMPTFYLTTLALRFFDVNILINLFPQPCVKYLKVLVVAGIGKPEQGSSSVATKKKLGREILMKARDIASLEKLEITDSGLYDDDFLFPGGFRHFTFNHLKMLNLSRTLIGDAVLLTTIHLSNLEALYVDETEVTYIGLLKLGRLRNRDLRLRRLRMVSALNCINVRVEPHFVTTLTELFSVQLYIDMKCYGAPPIYSH